MFNTHTQLNFKLYSYFERKKNLSFFTKRQRVIKTIDVGSFLEHK